MFPSPKSSVQTIKSTLEYLKNPQLLSPNNNYSSSNTKNTSTKTINNESFKEKMDKSQSSLKEAEQVIQNIEEKYNKSLKENFQLHQSLNEKNKLLEDEKKNNFALKAKIKELEGLLSIYSKEQSFYENTLKEKEEEIDEMKKNFLELKEKYMKASNLELQLENYQEILQELQGVVIEKSKECEILKEKNSINCETVERISKISSLFKEIFKENNENEAVNELDKESFERFLGEWQENLLKIQKILLETREENLKLKSDLKDLGEKQAISIKNKDNQKNKTLLEIQLKHLREIDKKNKNEIEKLFNLINLRKIESEKLQEENKKLTKENNDLNKKYLNSLDKIKNLEEFFTKTFKN